jgi:hypothetical protein
MGNSHQPPIRLGWAGSFISLFGLGRGWYGGRGFDHVVKLIMIMGLPDTQRYEGTVQCPPAATLESAVSRHPTLTTVVPIADSQR